MDGPSLRAAIALIGGATPTDLAACLKELDPDLARTALVCAQRLGPVANRIRADAVRCEVAQEMAALQLSSYAATAARPRAASAPASTSTASASASTSAASAAASTSAASTAAPACASSEWEAEGRSLLLQMASLEPQLLAQWLDVGEYPTLALVSKWLARTVEKMAEGRLGALTLRDPWLASVRRWRKGTAISELRWAVTLLAVPCKPLSATIPTSLLDDGALRGSGRERLRWIQEQGAELAARPDERYDGDEVDADEAGALVLYTSMSSPVVFLMNAALRATGERGGPEPISEWLPLVKLLLMATCRLRAPAPCGPGGGTGYWTPRGTLWRAVLGTDLRDEPGHEVGGVVRWWGFSSCSCSRWAAMDFPRELQTKDAVLHEEASPGAPRLLASSVAKPHGQFHTFCQIDDVSSAVEVARYSRYSRQHSCGEDMADVLILPGTRLEVLAVREEPFGIFIHLRECLM
jgi:hypothetical protein